MPLFYLWFTHARPRFSRNSSRVDISNCDGRISFVHGMTQWFISHGRNVEPSADAFATTVGKDYVCIDHCQGITLRIDRALALAAATS